MTYMCACGRSSSCLCELDEQVTAPDPMTGPTVDVDGLQCALDATADLMPRPLWVDEAGAVINAAGFSVCGNTDASDADLIVALVNAAPALLAALRDRDDLIRRQDAALTAVRELADGWGAWAFVNQDPRNQLARQLTDALSAALASPDTTQEADRG